MNESTVQTRLSETGVVQRVEQHYDGCPCPPCVTIRAAQPTTHAIQAKHLSGASIGKLVEYEVGRSLVTNEHQWSPAFKLRGLTHTSDEVELEAYGGNYGLNPNDWVRVTRLRDPELNSKQTDQA